MEVGESARGMTSGKQERRDDARLAVDEEASLLLLSRGAYLACRIVEISLTGCRMRTRDRFLGETGVRVEAVFRLCGIALRFNAMTEWTNGKHLVGIRFVDVAAHRMDELAEVLCEIAAESAAMAVKQAAERQAAKEKAAKKPHEMQISKPSPPPAPLPASASNLRPAAPAELPELEAVEPDPQAAKPLGEGIGPQGPATSSPSQSSPRSNLPSKPAARDRRSQPRHNVDTSATILVADAASRINGRILNLSLGGCRIRTEEHFPVGIYTGIEIEFHLEGKPFRLGGVVQAIQDRQFVGIRFLNMRSRKREQIEQLIAEIDELRQARRLAESQVAAAHALEA